MHALREKLLFNAERGSVAPGMLINANTRRLKSHFATRLMNYARRARRGRAKNGEFILARFSDTHAQYTYTRVLKRPEKILPLPGYVCV